MLINPQTFVEKGFVKSRFPKEYPLDLRDSGKGQVQQAGFDMRVAQITRIVGSGMLGRETKKLPEYVDMSTNDEGYYVLQPNVAYAVDLIEEVNLPVGFEGKLVHRSTLNRMACYLFGSVYDPGYSGLVGGTLHPRNTILVQVGARIGQFQIQTAEEGTAYKGDYQGQTSHKQAAEKVNGPAQASHS